MDNKQLIDALDDLRNDPTIAGALSANRHEHSTGPVDESPADSRKPFDPEREEQRQSVGTEDWLKKHRDDITSSERKRVEDRMRAENLFAVAQMEYEQFVSDLKTHGEEKSPREQVLSPEYRSPGSIAAKSEQVYGKLFPGVTATPSPGGGDTAVYGRSPASAVRTLDHTPSKPAAARQLPADARVSTNEPRDEARGEEDDDALYQRKVNELSRLMGGTPSAPETTSPQPRSASPAQCGADSSLRSGATTRFEKDYAALVEAVEQRDRTITRLEQLLREEKDYYETQLAQKRSELQTLQSTCDARVTSMKKEMLDILNASQNTSTDDRHDIYRKLTSAERNYDHSVSDLRTESSTLLQGYHTDCDRRIREVTETAERAIRDAKDAYVIDYNKALDNERMELFERLQRDQALVLREAELQLRHELEQALVARVKSSVEASVRAQLKAELLPLVKRELADSLKADLQQLTQCAVQTDFDERVAEWKAEEGIPTTDEGMDSPQHIQHKKLAKDLQGAQRASENAVATYHVEKAQRKGELGQVEGVIAYLEAQLEELQKDQKHY